MTFKPNDETLIKKYPHFERILDECFELDKKIEKLTAFLSSKNVSTVPVSEVDLLKEQLGYMEQYSSVLKRRIEAIRLKE